MAQGVIRQGHALSPVRMRWWGGGGRQLRAGVVATVVGAVAVGAVLASVVWSPWWWAGKEERALVTAPGGGAGVAGGASTAATPLTPHQVYTAIGGQPAPGTLPPGGGEARIEVPAPAAAPGPAVEPAPTPAATEGGRQATPSKLEPAQLVPVDTDPASAKAAPVEARTLVPVSTGELVPVAGGTPGGSVAPAAVAPVTPVTPVVPAPVAPAPAAVPVVVAPTAGPVTGYVPAATVGGAAGTEVDSTGAPITRVGANQPPGPGINNLDIHTSTAEGGVGQWQPWFSSTVSSTATDAHSGDRSLLVTVQAAFGWGIEMHNYPGYAAAAGRHRISFWGKAVTGSGLEATMSVRWSDAYGTTLSVDRVTLALTDSWGQASSHVTAPSGTANVEVEFTGSTGQPGDALLLDDIVVTPTT